MTLRGNTPPAAIAANDRGPVNPGMAMGGLILTLRRSPEQQAAFDAFVASQYDPNSPNFHQWLQPDEVGEKFGPALQDIATVSNWLSSHGLTVESVSKDRMAIRFSGTAAQVEDTFHTEIHNLVVKGAPHIANMTDPQIPMALEPVVLGPKALHNFVPRPLHRLDKIAVNKGIGNLQRLATADAKPATPRPEMGFSCGTGCLSEDLTPYDFATIYNVAPLWNASTPIDGTGQKIAIVGTSDVRASDVSTFRSTFGLGSSSGTYHLVNNGADPGYCTSTSSTALCGLTDQQENALDVEWSGAVAKGAAIYLVVTAQTLSNDPVFDSAQYVVTNKTAPVLNVSYGLCELAEGTAGNASYNSLWQSAASEGIAVFAASGDAGSATCDQGGDAAGTPYEAQFGLSVSGLASSQYDTAVGGTDLNWGATASPYWNTTDNSTTGATAIGYVPEIPWNDTCTNPLSLAYIQSWATALNKAGYTATSPTDAESACNFVVQWSPTILQGTGTDISFLVDTVGGGGGASNCISNSTTSTTTVLNPASCGGGYAKPSWQANVTGIPSDSLRDVPDVSFFAGNGVLGSAYLICVTDWGPCVTSPTATTEPTDTQGNLVNLIGGTSVASPAMAGVMALINQKAGSAQGNPNAELYGLAAKQTYSSCSAETVKAGSSSCYFNDPDTGTNAVPCVAGSPDCTVTHTGDTVGVINGYGAAAGYDLANGLGSLNVANVVNAWGAAVTGTGTATVAVSANPTTFTSAQGTTVTITVTGSSATPTGTIVLTSGTFVSATKSLASGTVTFNLSPGVLAAGTDTITASYSGDSVYAAATGSTSVTVTAVNYGLAATTPAGISPGSSASSTITVSTTNGYAGAVTMTCALTTSPVGASDLPTCAVTGSPVTLTSSATSGTATVSVATTAASSASMAKPRVGRWAEAGGGAVLALLVFFGIPARRRGWRAMLGMVVMVLALGSLGACGGGGSGGGGGGGNSNPGTTAGSYVFTVTGTGNPTVSPTPTTTFTVTVN